MNLNEDHIALAAEYVLGTLDLAEREEAERLMAENADFAALVRKWEGRLGELHALVAEINPPEYIWERIRAAIAVATQDGALVLPHIEDPPQADVSQPVSGDGASSASIIDLTSRMQRWRNVASLTGALAASLAAVVVLGALKPEMLPASLRPAPRIEVVKVETPAAGPAQFVAVLQRDANAPAFIMTVDVASRSFTVRRVSAEPEQGKSYELWLVSEKFPAPRSLGVIGDKNFTIGPKLASYDAETINNATYAVSIEPEGGSPTGVATGPIVYTGKLVETLPAAK